MERWEEFEGGTRRAPRFAFDFPLQYRPGGEGAWRQGRGTNISRSGLLFRAAEPLDVQSPIEVSFVVPVRVQDEPPATVICQGHVCRVARDDPRTVALAATIEAYRFERETGH